VMRHGPRRQPSATVVVVAGAGGAEPVGVGPGPLVGDVEPEGDVLLLGDVVGVLVSVGVGLAVSVGVGSGLDVVGAGELEEASEPPWPDWPHTAPAMIPTTAVMTRATTTMAAGGIAPRSLRMGSG